MTAPATAPRSCSGVQHQVGIGHQRRAERLHEVLVPVTVRWVEPSRRAAQGVCGGG